MKRPLAYITAAWCGDDDDNMERAARYCRIVYEAGFSPVCPALYLNKAATKNEKPFIIICDGVEDTHNLDTYL